MHSSAEAWLILGDKELTCASVCLQGVGTAMRRAVAGSFPGYHTDEATCISGQACGDCKASKA